MNRLKLVLLALVFVASAAHATVISGPFEYNGHDYYVLAPQSWWDAEAEALTLGGHLAAINDQAEQDFVYGLIEGTVAPHWIGFTDEDVEGEWIWTNDNWVLYTNWSEPFEPSNTGGI
jgi:hypothetical protein